MQTAIKRILNKLLSINKKSVLLIKIGFIISNIVFMIGFLLFASDVLFSFANVDLMNIYKEIMKTGPIIFAEFVVGALIFDYVFK